jgi:hypothetical protein
MEKHNKRQQNTTFSKKLFMASQYYQQLTGKKRHSITVVRSRTGSAGLSAASNSPPRRSSERLDLCRNDDLQLRLFAATARNLIDIY